MMLLYGAKPCSAELSQIMLLARKSWKLIIQLCKMTVNKVGERAFKQYGENGEPTTPRCTGHVSETPPQLLLNDFLNKLQLTVLIQDTAENMLRCV